MERLNMNNLTSQDKYKEEFFKMDMYNAEWLYNFYIFNVNRDVKTEESDKFFESLNWWIIKEKRKLEASA